MARSKEPLARNCVSPAQAARLKGVSKEAIRQAIKRGALRVVTLSPRLTLIPLDALTGYVPIGPVGTRKKAGAHK